MLWWRTSSSERANFFWQLGHRQLKGFSPEPSRGRERERERDRKRETDRHRERDGERERDREKYRE